MDEDRPLYAINDQVIVSRHYRHDEEDVPEGIATVVSFDVGYIFYDIRFNIDRPNKIYKRVHRDCLRPHNTFAPLARQTNKADITRPSILSPAHNAMARQASNILLTGKKASKSPIEGESKLSQVLHLQKNTRANNKVQPLLDYLIRNQNKPFGWLRLAEAKFHCISESLDDYSNKRKFKQLSEHERHMISLCESCLPHYRDCEKGVQPTRLLNHAWGLKSRNSANNVVKHMKSIGTSRRKRSDMKKTIFNCQKQRRKNFSPFKYFTKMRSLMYRRDNKKVDFDKIKSDWEGMSAEMKIQYKQESDRWMQRAPFLAHEIVDFLMKTNGSASWRQIECFLQGGENRPIMISSETIRKNFMALEGSRYTSPELLPSLNADSMRKRMNWANGFWVFWNTARTFKAKTRILLVHMDEKWFHAIVLRKFSKLIPAVGVLPTKKDVHHKSHIDKIMCICFLAFLPEDNDISKGGKAYNVGMWRAGHMVEAKRNSYRRRYREDGSMHYPQDPEGLLRRAGELYFQPAEVTGAKETGKDGKLKFSLLLLWQNEVLPTLDELVLELEQWLNDMHGGVHKVLVRYQEDGAGPHTATLLIQFLLNEFRRRQWMLVRQPANSPITNVMDYWIFPALSKTISAHQAVVNQGNPSRMDELWRAINRAYDFLPRHKVAACFTSHHQVVNAIADSDGGDEYARKSGGLHFGMRKSLATQYNDTGDPIGAVVVLDEGSDEQIDQTANRLLKYERPDVSNVDVGTLLNELELLAIKAAFDREELEYDPRFQNAFAQHGIN